MVYQSITTIKPNQWTFVSLKYSDSSSSTSENPGEITLYVNHTYQKIDNWATSNRKVNINSTTISNTYYQRPLIGRYQNTDYFNGKIDDFRFYETDLLDEDIMKLYNRRININTDSDFILYKHQFINKDIQISNTDTDINLVNNKYISNNDYIRIKNEIMLVKHVEDNINTPYFN